MSDINQIKPISITLTGKEVMRICLIFDLFKAMCDKVEIEIPSTITQDISTILGKMVDELSLQVLDNINKNEGAH